ncbi:hypothetical protein C8R45DRAFT_1182943 [Mycena sanguinolenta]|nr:hypothetical protein C8R45DRAFT_1182943 [Mycena sanguinolenta]
MLPVLQSFRSSAPVRSFILPLLLKLNVVLPAASIVGSVLTLVRHIFVFACLAKPLLQTTHLTLKGSVFKPANVKSDIVLVWGEMAASLVIAVSSGIRPVTIVGWLDFLALCSMFFFRTTAPRHDKLDFFSGCHLSRTTSNHTPWRLILPLSMDVFGPLVRSLPLVFGSSGGIALRANFANIGGILYVKAGQGDTVDIDTYTEPIHVVAGARLVAIPGTTQRIIFSNSAVDLLRLKTVHGQWNVLFRRKLQSLAPPDNRGEIDTTRTECCRQQATTASVEKTFKCARMRAKIGFESNASSVLGLDSNCIWESRLGYGPVSGSVYPSFRVRRRAEAISNIMDKVSFPCLTNADGSVEHLESVFGTSFANSDLCPGDLMGSQPQTALTPKCRQRQPKLIFGVQQLFDIDSMLVLMPMILYTEARAQALGFGFRHSKPKPKPARSQPFGLAWLVKPRAWLQGLAA